MTAALDGALLVKGALSQDELTRLWGLLGLLGAMETDMRSLRLMLAGLQQQHDPAKGNRDLGVMINIVEQAVERYTAAGDTVFDAIMKRPASAENEAAPEAEAARPVLH